MLCVLFSVGVFLDASSVRLRDGQRATVKGKGSPVLFSPGLFGTMPSFMYGALLREMRNHVSVVTLDGVSPVTRDKFDAVADALRVDTLGFLSHSSFDVNVLRSPHLHRAVLADPIVFPTLGGVFPNPVWTSPSVDLSCDVLTFHSELAYERGDPPIPSFLEPVPIDPARWTNVTMHGVGHVDLLDDVWSDLGVRLVPFFAGPVPERRAFEEWSMPSSTRNVKRLRQEYRTAFAQQAVAHLLGSPVKLLE